MSRPHTVQLGSDADIRLELRGVTRRINMIVVHHTWAPTAAQYRGRATIVAVRDYHMKHRKWGDNGYHLMVGPNGDLWACRPVQRAGAHTLNYNAHSIGISCVANFDVENPATYGGMDTLYLALATLCRALQLPVSAIRFHREFASKSCPGTRMNLTTVRQAVAARLAGGGDAVANIPDVDDYAAAYVDRARAEGLVSGYPDGTMRGREPIQRQDSILLLMRLLDKLRQENRALEARIAALEAKP